MVAAYDVDPTSPRSKAMRMLSALHIQFMACDLADEAKDGLQDLIDMDNDLVFLR
jgi:hypothetical protein